MKSLFGLAIIVLSTNAFAMFPSISNNDFDATVKKANQVAKSAAISYADSRAEELVNFTKVGSRGITSKYYGKTDTGCLFDVNVGLFFKVKVTPKANCL
jgi:hypothetical protein